jgi:hypothetical protein
MGHTFPATGSKGFGPSYQLRQRIDHASLQSKDKGLILVPLDGPPMRITPFVTVMIDGVNRVDSENNSFDRMTVAVAHLLPNASKL